jgi:hypothetical protein
LAAVVLTTTSAFAGTNHVPGEYGTIQEAIDAAVNGDEIVVADGTYSGDGFRDIDFGGKAIIVRSAGGAEACTIDIQADEADPGRAFWFHSGETAKSEVQGFKIQAGFMSRGGAVLCENGSSPLFQSCIFQQNMASQDAAEDGGGAVYILASSPMFADCSFVQNQAEANFLFGGGGAVRIQSESNPAFVGCTFNGNTAFGPEQPDGGAVAIWDGGHPEFFSCTFTENQAVWDGAVLCAAASVTMHDCHFRDNVATTEAAGAFGQYAFPCEVPGVISSTLVNCIFIGNSALNDGGGGMVLEGCNQGELDVCAALTNCHFVDNLSGGGGGLWVGRGVDATVTNCSFSGNTSVSGSGGGVRAITGALAQFTNCLFAENSSPANNGGGLFVSGNTDATVTNCTFAQNTTGGAGGGIRVNNTASAILDNCVLWGNLPNQINLNNAGPVSVNYSDIQGGWLGTGNSSDDPLFVDPDAGDFRLRSGSPCIDTGNNLALEAGIDTDLDGNPRFVNDPDAPDGGNGDPSIVDMGAYEFCRGDTNRDGAVDVDDLVAVILAWGTDDLAADTNADGIVDVDDVVSVILNWGPCQ